MNDDPLHWLWPAVRALGRLPGLRSGSVVKRAGVGLGYGFGGLVLLSGVVNAVTPDPPPPPTAAIAQATVTIRPAATVAPPTAPPPTSPPATAVPPTAAPPTAAPPTAAPPTAAPPTNPPPTVVPAQPTARAQSPQSAPCLVGQIKANRNSGVYHRPGGASYSQTTANVTCYDTEQQAVQAGFRAAER